MCGPDRVLLRPLRFTNGPFCLKIGLDMGRAFAKCMIFDEFFLKGPYADHILIPQGSTGTCIFLISNKSSYFSDCKSKISASNSL